MFVHQFFDPTCGIATNQENWNLIQPLRDKLDAGIAAALTSIFEEPLKDKSVVGPFISIEYKEGRAPPPPTANFVLKSVTVNAIVIFLRYAKVLFPIVTV